MTQVTLKMTLIELYGECSQESGHNYNSFPLQWGQGPYNPDCVILSYLAERWYTANNWIVFFSLSLFSVLISIYGSRKKKSLYGRLFGKMKVNLFAFFPFSLQNFHLIATPHTTLSLKYAITKSWLTMSRNV